MSIKFKLIILLLFLGLIPTLVVGVIAYRTISGELTNKTVDQLDSLAIRQERRLDGLLQDKKEETVKLANRYDLQAPLRAYFATSTPTLDNKANDILYTKKVENTDIQAIYLTEPSGKIIAATERKLVGENFKIQSDLDQSSLSQEGASFVIQEDPKDQIKKLFISTAIYINPEHSATLVVVFPLDDIVPTVQDYTGLGSTGETIVAASDTNNRYISLFPLRFDTEGALQKNVSSLSLSKNVDASTNSHVDYRGHRVVESVRYIPVTNWPLVTKIDTTEAFGPITKLRDTMIIIFMVSSIVITGVALYFTRFFTAPIIALTSKTRRIMEGDFTQRIAVTSHDEVGVLAKAFNEMAEGIQKSTRRLGEEHARLQASINSLDIGFLMTDKSGEVVSCNPALLQIFEMKKLSDKAAQTNPVLTLKIIQEKMTHFDFLKAIQSCLDNGKAFMAADVEYGNRYLSLIGAPIRLNGTEVIGSVVVVEDITEEKIIARSKDEFFSIASHELRTPLTSIRGNTKMILDYYASDLKDKDAKQMLDDIYESSVRLIAIVNDFLDVSSIEQDKILMKSGAFPIDKVIDSVVYEMQPLLKERDTRLVFDKDHMADTLQVWADPNRTKQIVYNLIGNAAKFTEHGTITISLSENQGVAKVTIVDTGTGIPADKQELLFRKFQQAGNSLLTRDTAKGTGLGLYISKMLVERMGGTIQLEKSKVGEGTTFSFTLPVATEKIIAAAAVVKK